MMKPALLHSGNQVANGENKHQPIVSEETGLINSKSVSDFKNVI